MGAVEIQGGGPGMQERRLTCAHCPVGLVALPLTWLVVKVFIISGAGVKAKAAVWPRGPTLLHPALLPSCRRIRDEQGMSSDKVLQHSVSVGTAQAITEQLCLAS